MIKKRTNCKDFLELDNRASLRQKADVSENDERSGEEEEKTEVGIGCAFVKEWDEQPVK